MSPLTHLEAAVHLRDAVTVLSERLGGESGELVPDASAERTATLVAALERGETGSGLTADDIRTLDSWIRLADSAVLHDDPAEAQLRTRVADRLRAIRTLVAPGPGPLTEDSRHDPPGPRSSGARDTIK